MNKNVTSKVLSPHEIVRQSDEALLLVTFGSTYPGPHRTFAHIRAFFAQAFPQRDIYMAFTSGMCMRRWFEKSGEQYYPADKWLDAIGKQGYKRVSVQSLHIIPGLEYSFIHKRYLPAFKAQYPHIPITIGEPLLSSAQDIEAVGQVIYKVFANRLNAGEALVMMGHGNHTDHFPEANDKYRQLNEYLQTLDPKIAIATVDYDAMLYEHLEEYLTRVCPPPTTINYLPLMSVAGDHALNDMVGDYEEDAPSEEQSWRTRLTAIGYISDTEQNCHMHGLGDYDEICEIWLNHLLSAEATQLDNQ